MLIYGRGATRTFAIGALFPAGICVTPVGHTVSLLFGPGTFGPTVNLGWPYLSLDFLEPNIAMLVFLNVYFAVVLGNGLVAVWVRRLVEAGRSADSDIDGS